ncbi:GlxA family transcriptional regulator [Neptunomonas antarctica]|uniref:Transcriptional regulator GlxA family, contains an amidase domain and an AraC-type DNA-binding HTH domain n=1 Tax=Neptunomonas antarctica TaxID=619304 RepID=A0A1N7J7Y2_9GAMM|nr:GlxA family transcriptional regulator [Neptunomonas antarctica]SIS45478.1 Transcriptional regulator GlxA family, contains an amidase domain and an AraC-type DNA-binding HTH domain [Neptunomonas antarctica]
MRAKNSVYLPSEELTVKPLIVGFVLLEHFSMMAFTAAVDALVTANLVNTVALFSHITIGIDSQTVNSDLGIEISTNTYLKQVPLEGNNAADVLIICGGFRCALEEKPPLSSVLKAAEKQGLTLGGIWNGAIALAHAGLLDGHSCAAHPDNHAYIKERFSQVRLSPNTLVIEEKLISCAGPVSALQIMLSLIEQTQGSHLARAVREILSCDQVTENNDHTLLLAGDNSAFPVALRNLLALMHTNIDEPLHLEELAALVSLSRRQIERMFQTYLETSPSRYYLELRLSYARRLLQQSNESIINISLACGFISTSHFSHCFKDYFGIPPSATRQKPHG